MASPLIPYLLGSIFGLSVLLTLVIAANKGGNANMGFWDWYRVTMDLEPSALPQTNQRQSAQAQPTAPQTRQAVTGQPRTGGRQPDAVVSRIPGKGFIATCHLGDGKTFEGHWDTGADFCLIGHKVARDVLGIKNPARELRHDTDATGVGGAKIPASSQEIDWIVEGVHVPNVRTLILHKENGFTGCLIGMSFISQVRSRIVGDQLYIFK
jgi:predicted aspartyl protease